MPMPMSMAILGLPATSAEARTAANQLTPAMSPQTSAAAAAATFTKVATSEGRAAETAAAAKQQLATATGRKCRTILSLFIVNAWSFLQELANCWWWLDDDHWAAHRRDVNAGQLRRRRTTIATDEEVSMAREHQQQQQKQKPRQQHEHLPGSSPVKSMRCTGAGATSTSTSTSTVAGQPLMALLIGLLLLDLRLAAGKSTMYHVRVRVQCVVTSKSGAIQFIRLLINVSHYIQI